VLWSDFINERIALTKRTAETVKQYFGYSKAKQDNIKDVGAFIAGYCREGKRNKANVKYRQAICLDADSGDIEQVSDALDMLNIGYCLYTTHKHTPERHRFRVVIPLSRRVLPEEYEAVARVVAWWLGIDAFDDTTYQFNRIMFFPSTATDGEYVFRYADAPLLNPDDALAELADAKDPTTWPTSSRVKNELRGMANGRKGDPAEKEGIVGAFCRSYDIHTAIATFIPDAYTQGSVPNRYTFTGGTTANGLVVYGDRWAYSHHEKDPARGLTLHAFDLVRMHLFGDKDEKQSFKAMLDFAAETPKVKKLTAEERRKRALADYEELEEDARRLRREYSKKSLSDILKVIGWIDLKEITRSKKTVSRDKYVVAVIEEILRVAAYNGMGLCMQDGFIYVYTGEYWQPVPEAELRRFLKEAAFKIGVPKYDAKIYRFVDELYKQFKSECYESRREHDGRTLINLLNGTYEIGTEKRELRKWRKEDFIKYQLPFNYDPKAKCPLFDKYIDRVLPDKDCQRVLAEYIGYVFTNGLNLEKALILYGGGANGKSVFFNVVKALLGVENISFYPIGALTKEESYCRAHLANRLLNYGSEIGGKMDVDVFKRLVSCEPVNVRHIYGTPFEIYDYAKLAFNCNVLPKDVEQTEAFFRRFLIVPFTQSIPKGEQDPTLARKIIKNELGGVFNWVLAGLGRLLEQGNFTESASVDEQRENYRLESDSVALFMDESNYRKSDDPKKRETLQNLYFDYKNFCDDNNYKACAKRTFKDRLINLGYFVKKMTAHTVVFLHK
jgi:putative DNA primase/helicase